jgi:GNAT superfamily N-acetyltransferase
MTHEFKNIKDHQHQLGDYIISTDKSLIDIKMVHAFLSKSSYWAQGRSYEVVKKSIEHSLCFGLYLDDPQNHKLSQVGFGRIVTDYATFAWLCDVFIIGSHRGKGLGKWLLECIISYPDLQGLQRFVLTTRDAHELYQQFGFENLTNADRWMILNNAD